MGREAAAGAFRNVRLYTVSTRGGPPRDLTGHYDRRAGATFLAPPSIDWSPDSRFIFITVVDHGRAPLVQIDTLGEPKIKRVTGGDNSVASFTISKSGQLAYALSDMLHPNEVWITRSGRAYRLTQLNDSWLGELKLSPPKEIEIKSFDGRVLQGWVLRPPRASADEPLPTLLDVHGGPNLWFGHDATWFHLWQSFCARGYMVLCVNPRGSAGYGEEFGGLVRAGWGEGDFHDVMAAVDEVVARGWADPQRLMITGLSYGGFMTNWAIGHTDRFRAAISRGGISNFVSFPGTSDIRGPYGSPRQNMEKAVQGSPLTFAASIQTPTLFSHGETDYRVPITQSEELYQALQARSVPTVMVRWPGQGHIPELLGPPKERVELARMFLAWLDHYAKN